VAYTSAFCGSCGTAIESGDQFCSSCGTPTSSHPPMPQPAVPMYAQMGRPTATQQSNGLAIASLVLGIVWLSGLGSILAVIFGFVSRKQIDQSGGRQSGRGMSTAGIILGFIGIAGTITWIVLLIVLAHRLDTYDYNNIYNTTTTF
jgi:hypothetical protein